MVTDIATPRSDLSKVDANEIGKQLQEVHSDIQFHKTLKYLDLDNMDLEEDHQQNRKQSVEIMDTYDRSSSPTTLGESYEQVKDDFCVEDLTHNNENIEIEFMNENGGFSLKDFVLEQQKMIDDLRDENKRLHEKSKIELRNELLDVLKIEAHGILNNFAEQVHHNTMTAAKVKIQNESLLKTKSNLPQVADHVGIEQKIPNNYHLTVKNGKKKKRKREVPHVKKKNLCQQVIKESITTLLAVL